MSSLFYGFKSSIMKNWKHYKNKEYTQNEARKMGYELDLIHDLVTEIYNDDNWNNRIKEQLDKIERLVTVK